MFYFEHVLEYMEDAVHTQFRVMGNGWTGPARYLAGGTELKEKEVNIRIKIIE